MADDGPWFYTVLSSSKDNPYDLLADTVAAPFPGLSIIGGENLVILKNTRHLQASWTFVKWMTGKEAQEIMFKVGQIPTNRTTEVPEAIRDNPFFRATMEGIRYPYLRPPIPELDDVETIFNRYMLQIFTDKLPVKEGLDRAAAEIEAAIR
jgi:multiple sugar transport system substrate-binding protein